MSAQDSIFMALKRGDWLTSEVAYLRENYPLHGAKHCAAALNRPVTAVSVKARKEKLKAPDRTGKPGFARIVSPAVDAQIRAFLTAGSTDRGALTRFCEQTGYTRAFVRSRALTMGLVVPNEKAVEWSAEEDAFLEEVAHLTPCTMYRKFKAAGYKRSESAIVQRRNRRELDAFDPDSYEMNALGRLMGVDGKVVARWVHVGGLKASQETPKGCRYRITRKDFRAWAKTHVHEIAKHSRKADQLWLIETLLGV